MLRYQNRIKPAPSKLLEKDKYKQKLDTPIKNNVNVLPVSNIWYNIIRVHPNGCYFIYIMGDTKWNHLSIK